MLTRAPLTSRQSAKRAFEILTLWDCAGRAAETSHLIYAALKFNLHYQCTFIDVPQSKVSKLKKIAFVAGARRQCCWYLHL